MKRSSSLHYAAGARVRERRKKSAAPVGPAEPSGMLKSQMTMGVSVSRYVGAPFRQGRNLAVDFAQDKFRSDPQRGVPGVRQTASSCI
jgi:hypothetical protein